MVKVIDKVREISKRIPLLDINGREFGLRATHADVSTDDFLLCMDKPVQPKNHRKVQGIWRGHDDITKPGKENGYVFTDTGISNHKRTNQHTKLPKKERCRQKDAAETPPRARIRKESLAWCKLLYDREYLSSSPSSSDSSFERRRGYVISPRKRPKLTRATIRRRLASYADGDTTTAESPSSTKMSLSSRKVKFQEPVYTTIYMNKAEADSPTSVKTEPLTGRATKEEPIYTTLYVPTVTKRTNRSSRHKSLYGQLNIRVSAQENSITVTVIELTEWLTRRDECFVHVTVSLQPDFPQRERFRTQTVPISCRPAMFNETFTLNVPEIEGRRRLLISVWENVKGRENRMFAGCMSFSANKLVQGNQIVEGWYQLLGETLGKTKHCTSRNFQKKYGFEATGDHGEGIMSSQPQSVDQGIAIDSCYKNYPQIGRSRRDRFQLHSNLRRESSCESSKTTQTDYAVKRTKLRNPATIKTYESDTGRLATTRCHRQDKKSYIGRSPVRPKWRSRKECIADSPKFVTGARIVKTYRSKSAKVISRRHQQLRLRGNSPDVKVLYTDEKECQTHMLNSASSTTESVCNDIESHKAEGIDQCINNDKLIPSKEQETSDPTLTDHPPVVIPSMTSGMDVHRNNKDDRLSGVGHLPGGPSFDHLTVTKSGRVKERKQMRSPTLYRATHVGQAISDNEGLTFPEQPVGSAPKEDTYKKEHFYASIDEIRQEIALSKSTAAVNTQQPIVKSPVRRSKSSGDQLNSSPSKRDFNMNLMHNRKRNSNTDSGIFVQLETAGAEKKVAELFNLNAESQKAAKIKNSNDGKTTEKENKEPLSTTKEADVPRLLSKGSIFSASAKRANKKSFRQSKKLSTCDPSKANELTLKELLKNKAALNAFREFLTSEHSTENLDFWLACESYKSVKESKMLKTAHGIFTQYLARSAPREVNMELSIRNRTEERLKHIDKETFAEAQECIFNLMRTDSFRRFLATGKYQALMETSDTFKLLPRLGSARRK